MVFERQLSLTGILYVRCHALLEEQKWDQLMCVFHLSHKLYVYNYLINLDFVVIMTFAVSVLHTLMSFSQSVGRLRH